MTTKLRLLAYVPFKGTDGSDPTQPLEQVRSLLPGHGRIEPPPPPNNVAARL